MPFSINVVQLMITIYVIINEQLGDLEDESTKLRLQRVVKLVIIDFSNLFK